MVKGLGWVHLAVALGVLVSGVKIMSILSPSAYSVATLQQATGFLGERGKTRERHGHHFTGGPMVRTRNLSRQSHLSRIAITQRVGVRRFLDTY